MNGRDRQWSNSALFRNPRHWCHSQNSLEISLQPFSRIYSSDTFPPHLHAQNPTNYVTALAILRAHVAGI